MNSIAYLYVFIIFLLFYSYAIYPALVILWPKKKLQIQEYPFSKEAMNLPKVAIIMSVFNGESALFKKIHSVFKSNYPQSNFEFLIGLDACTDKSEAEIMLMKPKFPNLHYFSYPQRRGKAAVLNDLVENTHAEILIFTDLYAFFQENTIWELVKQHADTSIGMVGACLYPFKNKDISMDHMPEMNYSNSEMKTKISEGEKWGRSMGLYGACYALKHKYFQKFPEGIINEDFFQSFLLLSENKSIVMNRNAFCFQEMSIGKHNDFRRRIRISRGNFQFMIDYKSLLISQKMIVLWMFFSHKFLRWISPLLIILLYLLNLLLLQQIIFNYLFWLFNASILISLLDTIIKSKSKHILIIRYISHFYAMNLAQLIGMIRFIIKNDSNIWQPTQRNERKH